MRKLLYTSIILTFFSISITIFQMSCSKPAKAEPPVESREDILVKRTWKVDELHHEIGCAYTYYINGGINTTGIPYENLRFKFNSDGTGTHVDQLGTSHSITWNFGSADKRSLDLTIPDFGSITYHWRMVELSGNYLLATVNLVIGGDANNMESFRLIQIP